MIVSKSFLEGLFGRQQLFSTAPLYLRFEQILNLYRQTFPRFDMGNSTTLAVHALGFVNSAKLYLHYLAYFFTGFCFFKLPITKQAKSCWVYCKFLYSVIL